MLDRIKKYILCFVLLFVPLLLSNVSHAMPDLYFYNNFLTGQSPYHYIGSGNNDEGVYYYPNIDKNENDVHGIVTSFSNQHMNGAIPPTAVPFVDLDYTVGKVFSLEPGECFVLGSVSGDIANLYCYGDFYTSLLGYSKPTPFGTSNDFPYSNIAKDTDGTYLTVTNLYSSIQNLDAFYMGYTHRTGNSTSTFAAQSLNGGVNVSSYLLFMNFSDETCFFSVSREFTLNSSSVVTYDAPSASMDKVSFLMTVSGQVNSDRYVIWNPHINGNIDIYSVKYSAGNIVNYQLSTTYNINVSLSLDVDENIVVGIDSKGMSTFVNCQSALINRDKLKPFFLNIYDGVTSLYPSAIYIKDGYVNVQNYEDLVALLKESGIGQADLTRVIELLTELNTGGVTGEEAKELIGILESYHEQLINQADFAGVTNVFDDYKDLLDFSEDMHWLITANNALFGYFAGFVMLCAMFLFLGRVMR